MRKRLKRGYEVSKYYIYKETLVDLKEHVWAFIGAFLGMGIIAYIQDQFLSRSENVLLIGSFGATSVLVYGAIQSPLAQPRNLIGGHVISAFVGVLSYKIFPEFFWIAAPLSVALSIVLMQVTKTLHPPGGATALIAVTGGPKISELGYFYIVCPVLSGALILLLVALVTNNMTKHRSYPTNKNFTRLIMRKEKINDQV